MTVTGIRVVLRLYGDLTVALAAGAADGTPEAGPCPHPARADSPCFRTPAAQTTRPASRTENDQRRRHVPHGRVSRQTEPAPVGDAVTALDRSPEASLSV